MTDLPTREQFAELIVNVCAGLTDDVMISGNPDSLLDPLTDAYSAALTRIEEMREEALGHGRIVIAALACATAAEQEVARLKGAIVDAVGERMDDTAWLRLVAIAAEGDGDATLS